MWKNQLSEEMAKKVINFYGRNGVLSDEGIKEFIRDSNIGISRYYDVTDRDVQIYKELFDLNKDGEICLEDLKKSFRNYLV